MAAIPQQVTNSLVIPTPKNKMISVKALAESHSFNGVPSNYTSKSYIDQNNLVKVDIYETIFPIIDFSHLNSPDPDQRLKAINDLSKACEEWGFFIVINHGISEELLNGIIDGCKGFFELAEDEKREYEDHTDNGIKKPIKYGTSVNTTVDNVLFWRDYFKAFVHPQFHFPNKPSGFSEISYEYCKRTREVSQKLLERISESLGLEGNYINKAMDMEMSSEIFVANLYPPCPQPELTMGLPAHSDPYLLTLLTSNGVDGLQLEHNGKWIDVTSTPINSIMVNVGDQLEILSNGKFKSVVHQVVVNNKTTRISLAMEYGPSLEAFVSPIPKLLDNESHHPPMYRGKIYKDYLQLLTDYKINRKSFLDQLRIQYSTAHA